MGTYAKSEALSRAEPSAVTPLTSILFCNRCCCSQPGDTALSHLTAEGLSHLYMSHRRTATMGSESSRVTLTSSISRAAADHLQPWPLTTHCSIPVHPMISPHPTFSHHLHHSKASNAAKSFFFIPSTEECWKGTTLTTTQSEII